MVFRLNMLFFFQELENPIILIHEKKVSDMNSLLKVLEAAVKVIPSLDYLLLEFFY